MDDGATALRYREFDSLELLEAVVIVSFGFTVRFVVRARSLMEHLADYSGRNAAA